MGQFKPMVKMMTTEPSVELKLKKGGKVEKKMQMGGLPDMAPPAMPNRADMMGAPAGMSPPVMPARGGMMGGRPPMRPSMAARRRAMMAMPAGAAPAAPVGMAGRVMKEGGESKAEHKAEAAKMSRTARALKEHADKPASKAHKGLKTGGVVMGQGGYKAGGIINTEKQGGDYRNTKMHDDGKEDAAPKKTGEVKMGKPGGYATGGVAKANAGGYKKGGAAKKAYAAGGIVDSGSPVAMPQGRKSPTPPVTTNKFSGTFKKGGKVTAAEGRLQKAFTKENATAMRQAKAGSNEVYSRYGKKMASGGDLSGQGQISDAERRILEDVAADARNEKGYENYERRQREENEAMRNAILGAPRRMIRGLKGLFPPKAPEGSVTKTERSVTVTPAKKRGGAVC